MAAGDSQDRREPGGIIGLAEAVKAHRGVIEYDLLTRTGHELRDVGGALSWDAFGVFLRHVRPDSELFKELEPELAGWATQMKTNQILADIYDMLAIINANLMAKGTGEAAKKPKPYKRPGKQPDESQHIGAGALPPNELHKWIKERRAGTNARNSTGDDYRHSGPAGSTGEVNE